VTTGRGAPGDFGGEKGGAPGDFGGEKGGAPGSRPVDDDDDDLRSRPSKRIAITPSPSSDASNPAASVPSCSDSATKLDSPRVRRLGGRFNFGSFRHSTR
jgi:hypothetical protein